MPLGHLPRLTREEFGGHFQKAVAPLCARRAIRDRLRLLTLMGNGDGTLREAEQPGIRGVIADGQ